jgi:hypothetical protein
MRAGTRSSAQGEMRSSVEGIVISSSGDENGGLVPVATAKSPLMATKKSPPST